MPVEQIQEAHAHEENVTDQWEASMALVCLQGTAPEEDLDLLVEGDEVLKEIPDLSILSLSPIILDGKEFLFLDDISKTIGLREDEALSVLAVNAGAACKSTDKGKAKIEFEDNHLTKALAYNAGSSSLEAVVAKALIEIKEAGAFYESVPDSAFEPHLPLYASQAQDQGSINLTNEQIIANDDGTEVRPQEELLIASLFGS